MHLQHHFKRLCISVNEFIAREWNFLLKTKKSNKKEIKLKYFWQLADVAKFVFFIVNITQCFLFLIFLVKTCENRTSFEMVFLFFVQYYVAKTQLHISNYLCSIWTTFNFSIINRGKLQKQFSQWKIFIKFLLFFRNSYYKYFFVSSVFFVAKRITQARLHLISVLFFFFLFIKIAKSLK